MEKEYFFIVFVLLSQPARAGLCAKLCTFGRARKGKHAKMPPHDKGAPSSRKHAPSSGVTFSAKATRVVVGQQYNPVIQPSAGQSKRQTHPGKVTAGSHRTVDISRIAGMAAVEVILVGIEEVLHPGVNLCQ